MFALLASVRQALRSLRRTPGFTLAAILTLALGTGGAITFFSALWGAVLGTPPYPHAERIHQVVLNSPKGEEATVSAVAVREMAAASPGVEALGVYTQFGDSSSEMEVDNLRQRIPTAWVDAPLLDVLGPRLTLGTGFQAGHYASGEGVIVTDRFWKQHLGGDPGVVGRTLPLLAGAEPIVGVLPADFELPFALEVDLLRPLQSLDETRRGLFAFTALARLGPGMDPRLVAQQFGTVGREQARQYPSNVIDPLAVPALVPLRKAMAGTADSGFFLVCGAAALLLLLATVNVAALFLNRAAARTCAMAVRMSLGASRGQLLRTCLPESLVVAFLGSGLGFLLAIQMGQVLGRWLPGGTRLHGLAHAWAHPAVTLLALGLVLVLGLVLGWVPLLQYRNLDVFGVLRASAGHSQAGHRVRDSLVVAQLALATLLLFGVGLLGRSLWRLTTQPTGIATGTLVVADLELKTPGGGAGLRDLAPLLDYLRARHGIQGAAMARAIPTAWGGAGARQVMAPGGLSLLNGGPIQVTASADPARLTQVAERIHYDFVSAGYPELLGLPLVQGRTLTDADLQGRRRVCVLDRHAAARFFPEGALGRRLHVGLETGGLAMGEPLEVVGIVGSFRARAVSEPEPAFVLLPGSFMQPMRILLRSRLAQGDLRGEIAGALAQAFPEARLRKLERVDDLHWKQALPRRQLLALLVPFGALALLLAALGLGALMASQVAQRTRELGIRATVGARPAVLLAMVLGAATRRSVLGILIGLGASLALSRTVAALLYGVTGTDGVALAWAILVLLATSLLAALVPAVRAARIQPAEALRTV